MAALALAKWAFCLCKAALLFLAPANRRRVPPVQSMIPATWLAQSLWRHGVTFVVAQGGVSEVGLSIKAAIPNAPACRKCLQQLLLNWLSTTCMTRNSCCTAAIHRKHLHLAIANDRLHYSTAQPPYRPPSKDASSAPTSSRPSITDACALGSPDPSSDHPSWVWHVVRYASLPLADQTGYLLGF
jgi:hypothetical protein